MNDMANGVIPVIKFSPTLGRKPNERVKVRIEMLETSKTEIEDLPFVEMWEFENGKY
jgi:3-polyprenyl-4-hydroxybenzoate decarboxylase